MIPLIAIIEFLLGGVAGGVVVWIWIRRHRRMRERKTTPADLHHTLDLLRRALRGSVVCTVGKDEEPVVSTMDPRPIPEYVSKVVATARLAMGDGRMHLLREDTTILAVGDWDVGAAVASDDELPDAMVDEAVGDLRRIVAGVRVQKLHTESALALSNREGGRAESGLRESVEGLAIALCEAARALTDRPAAVVVRDQSVKTIKIEAVSNGVDKRLKDLKIVGDSAVGRASMGDAPIVGHSARELFGAEHEDRRRNEEHGIAFPVRDGRDGVGALVVFGTVEGLDPGLRERVMWMALDAGPRLASAIAVRAAERRAMTDELTGLPNRRGLERVTSASPQLPCSILAVDLDHFKRVNDTFGHAAGDDALKHFSRILTHTLRDGDLAARIGGEEFAVWLPRTDRSSALEVAERLRYTAEERTWKWAGSEISITCSIGVASCPESVSQVANLGTTADAALYRAKELGRNRVESA